MKNKALTTKEKIMAVIAVFLIISMFAYFSTSILVAVFMGILGIMVLPWVNRKINDRFVKGNNIKKVIKIGLELIILFVIIANIPSTENVEENNQVAQETVSNSVLEGNISNNTNSSNIGA